MRKSVRFFIACLPLFLLSVLNSAKAQTIYTVGTGGNYAKIQTAYNACTVGGASYHIQLLSTYNSAGETTVNFGNRTASNNVHIYPQSGVTSIVSTSNNTNPFFNFTGGDFIYIYGNANRTGPSVWTVQNTAGSSTVSFQNESTYNTLTYLTIYGNATGSAPGNGVVVFGTAGTTYGNTGNELSYNTIGGSSVSSMPYQVISSNGTAAKPNDNIDIASNNIINFSNKGIYIDSISGNTTNLNIYGNSFYQTANYTVGTSIIMIDYGMGTNYNSYGIPNYFGGQAPQCGGAPFVIPSSANSSFKAVLCRTNCSGYHLWISIVKNIQVTTTMATGVPFIGMEARGTLGLNMNGSDIGTSCTLINNATGGSLGLEGVRISTSGVLNLDGFTIGGFTLSGSRNGATSICVNIISSDGASVSSSTIKGGTINSNSDLTLIKLGNSITTNLNVTGSTLGQSTVFNSSGTFSGIVNNSSLGLSVNGVTFTGITSPITTGGVEMVMVDNLNGSLSIGNCSFISISSANNAPLTIARNSGTSTDFNVCNVQSISQTSAGTSASLKIVTINSSSAANISGCIFGNATLGNIAASGNTTHSIISSNGTGSTSIRSNVFRNFAIGSGGAATSFQVISCTQGSLTVTDNVLQDYSVNTTTAADFAAIYAAATSNTITNTTIKNIQFTNTSANASINRALLMDGTGSGTCTKNIITGLTSTSTSTSAKIIGMDIKAGSWNLHNNAILLSNGGLTNALIINGIWCRNTTGSNALYHNTVKLSGTQVGNASTAAMTRTAAAINNVRNNVFQNMRTGGTLGHYAESTTATGYTTDYNYLEASNVNQLGSYAGVDRTLATWKTSALANNSITGTTVFDNIGRQTGTFVGSSSGTNLSATVADDRIGAIRPTNPALGAYQSSSLLTISNFSPLSGPIGTSVTITGTGFSTILANNIVRFGGMKATVSSATTTQLIVVVPVGASFGKIMVVAEGQVVESAKQYNVTNSSNCVYFEFPKAARNGGYCTFSGDFNDDGNPDILSKSTNQRFEVYTGNGSGQYSTTSSTFRYSSGIGSNFSLGDGNRDGKLDVLDVSGGGQLFLNGGAANFSGGEYANGAGSQPTVGDINNDGILDWVNTDGTNIYYAYGYGGFYLPCTTISAPGTVKVYLADFNNDGYLDLLSCNDNQLSISIYLGSSSGTYSTKIDYTTGTNGPYSATLADFDKDGDMDIAVGNNDNNSFSILVNAGLNTGTFPSKTDYVTTYPVPYIEAADINGDGNIDLAVTNTTGSSIAVYFGTGTGSFGFPSTFPASNAPTQISVGDFNKDGKQDIVCSDNSNLCVLLSTCIIPPHEITSFTPASGPVGSSVLITGKNFDVTASNNVVYFGTIKAVVTAATATQLTVTVPAGISYERISVVVNNLKVTSAGYFNLVGPPVTCFNTTMFSPNKDFASGGNISAIDMGDLNGDGKIDLVALNNTNATVSVYLNTSTTGTITYNVLTPFSTGTNPMGMSLGDLDNDGKPDIAVINNSSVVTLYRNTGAGTFATGVNFNTATGVSAIHLADLDKDGKTDICIGKSTTSGVLEFLKNISTVGSITTGSFAPIGNVGYNVNNCQGITTADFNNDGKLDIAISEFGRNDIIIFKNTVVPGNLITNNNFNGGYFNSGSKPMGIFATDLDGDGKTDYVVVNNGGTTCTVGRNTTTGTNFTFTTSTITTATTPSNVKVGDIDGDGKADILVTNYGSNTVSVFKNNSVSGTISFAAKVDIVNTGTTNPNVLSVGDIDGDGKPDLAVGAYTNGNKVSVFKNRILPTAVLSGTAPMCFGYGTNLSVALTGDSPWTVVYSDGTSSFTVSGIVSANTTIPVNPTTTKTYSLVSVTSASSCVSTLVSGTAVITVNPIPTLTTNTSPTKCGIGSINLTGTVSAGNINWYTADTANVPVAFTGMTYTTPVLTSNKSFWAEAISAQGCPSTTRTQINVIVSAVPTINTTAPGSVCNGGSIPLSVVPSIGTANWYTVLTGGTAVATATNSFTTPVLSSTITYYVDVTYGGCTSTPRTAVTAAVVPSPSINPTTDVERCGPGIVSLSVSTASGGGTVKWYAASTGGTSLNTGTSYSTSILTSTPYYVEVTDLGCISTPRKLINAIVNANPNFSLGSSNPTACASSTGSFTLLGLANSKPYTLEYSGASSLAITSTASGSYTVSGLLAGSYSGIKVTDAKGCVSTTTSTNLVDPNGPSLTITPDQNVCPGDNVIINSTNPNGATLTWSTGATSASINFTAGAMGSTSYSLTGDLAGCKTTVNTNVVIGKTQTINSFTNIITKDVFSSPFTVTATTTQSLPITFTSLDPFVATVSATVSNTATVTILGPGTARIQASQVGTSCYYPVDSILSFPVTGTLDQKITFGTLPTIAFGDIPFDLGATVNSPNIVLYDVSDPTVVKIVGNTAIGMKAGTVTIKAYALASANYNASDTVTQVLNVIIPPFKIFGSTIVQGENKENYFVSPNSPKYAYSWMYKGSDTYYVSDTVSRNVSLFFTKTATGDTLRCRIYSIASNTYVDVTMKIQVNPDIIYLPPVNCDSLKGTFTLCSGKFVNNFSLGTIANPNSGCDQGYSDFTRLGNLYTTDLYLGDSYNALVQVGNKAAVNLSANYVGAWLDYNNNGSFDDPNEFLISTYSADSTIDLKNLLIITNESYAGVRRLRIRVRSSGLFTFNESCVDFNESGETEDYKITLVIPDRLEAPVLLSPNEDGKNDLFIIKGIYSKPDAQDNKLTIMDRMGNILRTEVNYTNNWDGKDNNDKLLPRDTYYYNFVNGNKEVIRGYFEIRY